MPDASTPSTEAHRRCGESPAIERVLSAVRDNGGLPSVGPVLARLTQLLGRDSEGVHALADAILSDVGLTQRLLHLANTLPFRAGPVPVTTVTRAIMLLGVNRVQEVAVSLVLLDGIVGAANVDRVYEDFHQALLASSVAPHLLGKPRSEDAEMAGIAAMFRNVGRLLLAVYAPQALDALRAGAEERAAIGCSLDELTATLLRSWRLPDRIVQATQPPPARAAADPVRAAAHIADEVAVILREQRGANRSAALRDVCRRHAGALLLDEATLTAAIDAATARTRQFERATGLHREAATVAGDDETEDDLGVLPADSGAASSERDDSGKPRNATGVLLAGLTDAAEALARGADAATVVHLVLETIYSGMGYRRVALALRDGAEGPLRLRGSFGQPKPEFRWGIDGNADLFSAAMARATDLHIGDIGADKIRSRLPPWFAAHRGATRSFLLMPLSSANRPIGLIYADRAEIDAVGPSSEELKALRALRSQILLALRTQRRA